MAVGIVWPPIALFFFFALFWVFFFPPPRSPECSFKIRVIDSVSVIIALRVNLAEENRDDGLGQKQNIKKKIQKLLVKFCRKH